MTASDYQERKENRIARYRELADKNENAATAAWKIPGFIRLLTVMPAYVSPSGCQV